MQEVNINHNIELLKFISGFLRPKNRRDVTSVSVGSLPAASAFHFVIHQSHSSCPTVATSFDATDDVVKK
jgi:hypothetical protein